MTKKDFLLTLDGLLENEPGTLTGGESLSDVEKWDSLAVMAFMAMVDEKFGVILSPKQIAKCRTVSDLAALAGDKVTA